MGIKASPQVDFGSRGGWYTHTHTHNPRQRFKRDPEALSPPGRRKEESFCKETALKTALCFVFL